MRLPPLTPRAANAPGSDARVGDVKYAEGLHWHQLLFHRPSKKVLFHEPYGGPIAARGSIARAFNQSDGPVAGWTLESLRVALQSCTFECGVWEDWVSEVAVDWLQAGCTVSLSDYMASRNEITPLNQLTGAAKRAAQAKNNAFIAQRRRNARELLRRAYLEEGFVPSWGLSSVQIAAFSPSGSVTNPIFITASSDEEED